MSNTFILLTLIAIVSGVFRSQNSRFLKEISDQKKIIEEHHKEITDSINYAERIQRSFLATKENLGANLKEYFIFFCPKDIVSGDFYFSANLANNNFILATADSTGHGVPGAIMSLLNSMSLEKAVEQGITQPSKILDYTRKEIINRLKKDGSSDGGKDGMDCSLCVYDFSKMKLFVACANNPVWIVRNTEVIEIKPDKMPVGKSHNNHHAPFIQHEVDLQKGDVIYTFTDGYADQFGGPKEKKFKYKQLEEVLLFCSKKTMPEQKQVLESIFHAWKGMLEQVDDVLIIGVRV
ncbi:MAG: SpoIIE family protein phosphatase [Bacteroidetes bacterium]|nr:SpoIIE family protein phosphatase [Bacteroidota bacterium]